MSVAVANTTASLSGKTLLKAEDNQTITGQKTFDLGASAPFAVVSGAAKVDNLDADKLDGQDGADYHDAAQLTGAMPVTVVGADPNADRVVFWDDSANAYAFLALTGLAIRATSLVLPRTIPNGRLSLTSATPITTSGVTGAGTLYYTPYQGNQIALYNGTSWEMFVFAELSIAAPAAADQVYDVFVQYNAGIPQLSLVAWTNDTTRATALTTQDGVLVKTGATGDRYVGSVRTKTASQFNDSDLFRHCWNYYNRVLRPLVVTDATANWAYTTATVRQARANSANQVDVLVGVAEVLIDLALTHHGINDTGAILSAGIGEDSTTTYARGVWWNGSSAITIPATARLVKYPAVGRHFYSWNESSTAAGNTTWYGTNTQAGGVTQSGIYGSIMG